MVVGVMPMSVACNVVLQFVPEVVVVAFAADVVGAPVGVLAGELLREHAPATRPTDATRHSQPNLLI